MAHMQTGNEAVIGTPDPSPEATPDAPAVAQPPARENKPACDQHTEDEDPPEV